jgi:hypothetical protein
MSPTRQKKGPGNIPAKTAIPVSFVAMTAAGYASAKNPVTVHWLHNDEPKTFCLRNGLTVKPCRSSPHSTQLPLNCAFALDGRTRIVYRIFTINLNVQPMK